MDAENRRSFDQPYLETCCRSALHRVLLAGDIGRPPAMKDGSCLDRLATLALAREREDGRFEITDEGRHRHDALVTPVPRRPAA